MGESDQLWWYDARGSGVKPNPADRIRAMSAASVTSARCPVSGSLTFRRSNPRCSRQRHLLCTAGTWRSYYRWVTTKLTGGASARLLGV